MTLKGLKMILKNPKRLISLLGSKEMLNWIPDKVYLKIIYKGCTGKKLNVDDPQTFNEKLQWLKLYDRNPEYTKMVDKYEAKKYVAEKIGEEYIIPTLGVWDKFEDMDFNHLDIKNGHPNAEVYPAKPKCFDEMRVLAEKPSKGIPHLRVDFYEVDGKIYFGELTFSHWGGTTKFEPDEWDLKFGEYIKLPIKNKD